MSPALAIAWALVQTKPLHRDVDNAAGINEGLQKSSEMEWVSDTNGLTQKQRINDDRFDNCIGDDIQGSIELGLDLDKINEGNGGVSPSVKGHQKEKPLGPSRPSTKVGKSQEMEHYLRPTKSRRIEII
ncbi:hypothetical protein Ancab_012182 [Ancistrocladus abbreviatus]